MDIILKQMKLSNISDDDILDFMFDEIDDIQIDGNFEEVDDIFDEININNMSDITILGILTITYPYRKKYKNREKFFHDAEEFLKTHNTEEEVYELLHGFND